MNGRRSHIEVIADIMRLREASKTQIMYSVGMSYAQLQKYLRYLTEHGFLARESNENSGTCYRVTQNGKRLLEAIEKIEQLLSFDESGDSETIGQSIATSRNETIRKSAMSRIRGEAIANLIGR